MKFVLPIPPGINQTYKVKSWSKQVLQKSEEARSWEKEAGWLLKEQLLKISGKAYKFPMQGKLKVNIIWRLLHNRDVDAGIKIVLDFFQKHNIYADDKQIQKVNMEKIFDQSGKVEVEIENL